MDRRGEMRDGGITGLDGSIDLDTPIPCGDFRRFKDVLAVYRKVCSPINCVFPNQ